MNSVFRRIFFFAFSFFLRSIAVAFAKFFLQMALLYAYVFMAFSFGAVQYYVVHKSLPRGREWLFQWLTKSAPYLYFISHFSIGLIRLISMPFATMMISDICFCFFFLEKMLQFARGPQSHFMCFIWLSFARLSIYHHFSGEYVENYI